MPIGTDLTKLIAKSLDIRFRNGVELISGEPDIVGALGSLAPGDINPHCVSACQISAGMPLSNSIDSYMDMHRHDPRIQVCGKLGIAHSIMQAEQKSSLYIDVRKAFDPPSFFRGVEESWFPRFFKMLSDGITKSDIAHLFERVSFISFNYDRCLEQFMVRAIAAVYAVSDGEAQDAAHSLRVLHPYGTIGRLPWEDAQDHAPFGGTPGDPALLLKASQSIRTYTEQVEEGTALDAIRSEVAQADVILFLGFSFQPQNMDLLKPTSSSGHRAIRIYGTAKGISQQGTDVVRRQIAGMVAPRTVNATEVRNDLACSELLDTYSRNLTIE